MSGKVWEQRWEREKEGLRGRAKEREDEIAREGVVERERDEDIISIIQKHINDS